MNIYLVGGAVRDKLLGLPVKEHDWVVVGSTVEQMLNSGYQQVGSDFPVFLHPRSKEEYALARTERKTGPGYKGFSFDSSEKISLEEDLIRRDLTINAIAQDEEGKLIDPYKGQADIDKRILRHVSAAFVEDPVRLLRIGRFLARFANMGFQIAPETHSMLKAMVANGDVDNLTAERVWQELHKALQTKNPELFFETLQTCGALNRIFPQVNEAVFNSAQKSLIQACHLSDDPEVRFAAWLSNLAKTDIQAVCELLRAPKSFQELAVLVNENQSFFERSLQLPPPDILQGLKQLDGFRRRERFNKYLLAAEAVSRSDSTKADWPHPQSEYLYTALDQAQAITARNLLNKKLSGTELAEELDMHRRAAISKIKRTYRWSSID